VFIRISFVRSAGFITSGFLTIALLTQAASAQPGQIKERVVDDAANQIVASIQNDSCPQFEAMLKQHKSSGSSSNRASGMMKQDPAMRARFVDKVAGPLVNKMIDCDMLPGK
jgi:hypothetical protein